MFKKIVDDLKESTLTEKILLGIVAGIFSVLGFYLGYAYLSNGVNPFLVGIIAAIIVPIGGMSIAFILDELYKSAKRKFSKNKTTVENNETNGIQETTDETVSIDSVEPTEAVVEPMPESESIRVLPTTDGINDGYETIGTPVSIEEEPVETADEVQPEPEVLIVADPVDRNLPDAPEKAQEVSEATQGVSTVPERPERPTRPSVSIVETVGEESAEETSTPVEESTGSLTLADFIKAHPDYSPRKMAREYERAGGKESTENILELM